MNNINNNCTKNLGINGEYRWKIKLLKAMNKKIMLGIAQDDNKGVSPD